jgi:superfamily I DNA/RNA helicase
MPSDEERELKTAVRKVLESKSRKKLIVAGPGAGKTTLFQELLEQSPGGRQQRLVLTFIGNLRNDLKRSLGQLASVNTLHGYCQFLLRQSMHLRGGLTANFVCYPGLAGLIKQDWAWLRDEAPPRFVELMRALSCAGDQEAFYIERGDYYDAVDFDDSVHRVFRELADHPEHISRYELVLIDEFQDFNKMEAALVDLLGQKSPIIVAGDDDQALYSSLRGASWDYIRAHHIGGEYEVFELPFCMRCPEVIVAAVNDVLAHAHDDGKLFGRITKPFRYFAPVKSEDSRLNPQIDLVRTSVQSAPANYFGRYIERIIREIPEADFERAAAKHEPCVLIIGSKPYLPQVNAYLVGLGLIPDVVVAPRNERNEGLDILRLNPDSNLGWRILLACGDPRQARECVQAAYEQGAPLSEIIPTEIRTAILDEAALREPAEGVLLEDDGPVKDEPTPRILLTSYEGSKGLSAQYVILAGLHDGDLPRNPAMVGDIEICKFLVGLTRTKKKCVIIATRRFGTLQKTLSAFIGWIRPERFHRVEIDATSWR